MVEHLTERITLRSKSSSKQPNGEVIYTSTDLDIVWSKVEPLRGSEKFTGDKKTAIEKYRFVIRYRDDLDTLSEIFWDGKTYDVEFTEQYFKTGRRNFLAIEASYEH